MSLFDQYFRSASPHLMSYMATPASVTIILGEVTLVSGADGIIRHESVVDEETTDGEWIKSQTIEVDVMIDESSSYKGLADDYTNAVAIVDGVRWSVDEIVNKTKTFQRLRLMRKNPRAKRRTGFYRGA